MSSKDGRQPGDGGRGRSPRDGAGDARRSDPRGGGAARSGGAPGRGGSGSKGASGGRGASAGRGGQGAGRGTTPSRGGQQAGRPRRPGRGQPTEPQRDVHVEDGVRLQKVLASAGLGSRRACEELISQGRVEVDGVRVTELGVRIDPERAVVHVDGMRLQLDSSRVTLALNKPRGVVSTMHDPDGRPSVAELVADRSERLFHVGRLDADSEGLLLLTNDGELANHLAHPSHEVAKTYLVTVRGKVPGNVANKFLHGIELEDGVVCADAYRVVDQVADQTMIEVVLHSGRNRVVRRMFEEVGFPVTRLVRTRIGPIALGNLRPGTTRVLGRTELGSLMASVGL
ncbi:pseudouridine synthase [Cellulosimicrobium cellulans]|uniref:pseudouridine synthase n=1 Tax=Cellulosimicrobium cellulans TaxID=1710 RepID=UPI002404C5E5|nr:pseudouridine synthase [Cellulosimicrobium cellulans]MDF9874766.1 23S rRNA pseudouridine2605 synthase [Cellulosimicrobium cellulans]